MDILLRKTNDSLYHCPPLLSIGFFVLTGFQRNGAEIIYFFIKCQRCIKPRCSHLIKILFNIFLPWSSNLMIPFFKGPFVHLLCSVLSDHVYRQKVFQDVQNCHVKSPKSSNNRIKHKSKRCPNQFSPNT